MKKFDSPFNIPFTGLKIGNYTYDFVLDKAFFDKIEDSIVEDAQLKASLLLEKKETMMIGHFSMEGEVVVFCNKCNDLLTEEVEGAFRIVYKFGNEESEDESLRILSPDLFELDVFDTLYELIVVSLPARMIHDEGDCNPEVMKLYNQFIVNANEPEAWEEDMMDDEDWDDEDLDDEEDENNDDETPDPNKPIDPRWSILKNLN